MLPNSQVFQSANFPVVLSRVSSQAWKFGRLAMLFGLLAAMGFGAWDAVAAQALPTATTLVVSSGGNSVTTVASGGVVTLTSTVVAGSTPVTPGLVKFCDAAATYCEDIHIVGTAQLTAAGTAIVKFRPGIGNHSYKAVFAGTPNGVTAYEGSTSSSMALDVAAPTLLPSVTAIAVSGSVGNYSMTATVGGTASTAPGGTVSFLDSNHGNALLGSSTLGAGTAGSTFVNSSNPVTIEEPTTIVGDFNGDGIPDLAVFSSTTTSLTILLGSGDGTFTPVASVTPCPHACVSAVAGDFNGDGKLDLAVTNGYTADVTILLGNGDGTFTPAVNSPTSPYSGSSLAAADFNGDGNLDLIVWSYDKPNPVTVLLGDGKGDFYPTASGPNLGAPLRAYLAIGDFNGDGIPDLAWAVWYSAPDFASDALIFLGNGDGTFTETSAPTPAGNLADSIVVGDFNGDGEADLAIANAFSNNVTILRGNGDGTFATTAGVNLPFNNPQGQAIYVALGDFNGDGIPDLAAVWIEGGQIFLLAGDGEGNFTGSSVGPNLSQNQVFSITAGDLNGDGFTDLVLGDHLTTNLTVLVAENESATAAVNGIAIPSGTGTHQVVASYSGNADYNGSTSFAVDLTAGLGTPTVTLTPPASPVPYGTEITLTATVTGSGLPPTGTITFLDGAAILGTGTANSSGVATYTTAAMTLALGAHSISASYGGDSNYNGATSAPYVLHVAQATPAITWATPAAITYGTALTSTQLNASSSVTGSFVYSPIAGTVLTASAQTLAVTFTPTDTTDYTNATASVTLTVNKATPTITWATPEAITYGTALGAAQLNASSPVAGSFSYSPAAGTVPKAGLQTISVSFTPTDSTDYTTATATVTLIVNQVTPAITWAAPAAILYGTALGSGQLNASSSVAGTFAYSPAAGTVLSAGAQILKTTYTPTDTTDYTTATATVKLTVNQATPVITWATPAAIAYGTGLGAAQLNASSPAAGSFSYSPTAGTVLTVGSHTITATFTPADTTDYTTATATVTMTVSQATPVITWASPTAIIYGTALSAAQLNAISTVAGSFSYSPATGTVLGTGSHTITATFTPADTTDFTSATATVTVTVDQAIPAVTWPTPAAITYGTTLGSMQLNASSTVAGSFAYSPAAGTMLGAGPHTVTATFTPTDTTDYTGATATVTVTVNQATTAITWTTPAAITYGAALGALQLNASSSVAGAFAYSPAAGTVLGAGPQTLKVTLTPTDATDYTSASSTVTLTVNQATPAVTWATPAAITYGAALSAAQLNATSSVAGSFAYSPVSGTVLGAGTQKLTASFSPTDATDYQTATATVTLTVNQATPTISWATPAAITFGTALNAAQLDATASVPGSFVYSPALGSTPPVGNDTLTVTFTPTDNIDYAIATASVTLTVNVPPNPVPFIGNITPAIADAGGPSFTITVNGSSFLANSVVYWGTSALTTVFVSSTQLTATVTAADIATPGATAINVQNPAPGGGTSDILQFEVDSPAATATAPTVPSTVVSVTAGSTATYSISFPASVTNASATCLNLPAGAVCSYSFATGVLTISTSSTTPAGTYQVTVVFAETVTSTSTALIFLPFLLLPLFFLRRKLASLNIWSAVCLGLILAGASAFTIGCGGSSSPTKTTTTQSVTSSGVVGMTVQ